MTASVSTEPSHAEPVYLARIGKGRLSFYYLYIACLLGANGVVLIPRSTYSQADESTLFIASWLVILALSALAVTMTKSRIRATMPMVACFGLLILASAAWSVSPMDTIIYGTILCANIIFAYMAAADFEMREIVRLIANTIVVLAAAGLAAYFVGYRQVLYYDGLSRPNLWGGMPLRGFFPHKITGAMYAVIGCVAAISTYRGWIRIASLGILFAFITSTSSATGMVLLPTALAVYWITAVAYRRRMRPSVYFTSVGLILLVFVGIIWQSWNGVLSALGRDATLTGRTRIWSWGIRAWEQRPILGWGFNGYLNSSESATMKSSLNYNAPHFHQAYVQTAVDLGAVGLLVLVAVLISTMIGAYKLAAVHGYASGVAYSTMVAVLLAAGTVVLVFISHNSFTTWLLAVLFFSTRRQLMDLDENATATSGPVANDQASPRP